nr:uncharacterized protein CFP56_30086 [Quercus suber]
MIRSISLAFDRYGLGLTADYNSGAPVRCVLLRASGGAKEYKWSSSLLQLSFLLSCYRSLNENRQSLQSIAFYAITSVAYRKSYPILAAMRTSTILAILASALCVSAVAVPVAVPQDETAIGNIGNIIDGSGNTNLVKMTRSFATRYPFIQLIIRTRTTPLLPLRPLMEIPLPLMRRTFCAGSEMSQRLFRVRKWPVPTLRWHPRLRSYAQTPSESTSASRISQLEARLPKFLRRITSPLRDAPVSHITAFLVLHELTAIVPLFGLAAIFHYSNWLPSYISEGKWVSEGTEKFGRYLRKKGWINEETSGSKWWGRGEGGVRVVAELATAYAITKALLPLRLVLSVWGTPWFARYTVLPVTGLISRSFASKTGSRVKKGPAAGTSATGGGIVSKEAKAGVK